MPILPAEPEMYPDDLWEGDAVGGDARRRWYCLHTRPRQEKATARDLRARRVAFYLPQIVRDAQAEGELRSEDPDQLVFELNGYLLMANMAFLLYGSTLPIERAREAVASRLALSRA